MRIFSSVLFAQDVNKFMCVCVWGRQENTSATLNSKLSLFVACQSYLPSAALEFADMVRDLGDSCSAATVAMSEEAYWLRRASSRNRARFVLLF